MRVPEPVSNTLNAYLACRATLVAIRSFNKESLRVPDWRWYLALLLGFGGMEPRRCAAQMRVAFEQVLCPSRIPSFDSIHKVHQKLRTAS